jgi:hypothetical protein
MMHGRNALPVILAAAIVLGSVQPADSGIFLRRRPVCCSLDRKPPKPATLDIQKIPIQAAFEPEIQVPGQLVVAAGVRPVSLTVTAAPKSLVVRSAVTWGYTNSEGTFIRGGQAVFDHRGGVVTGGIHAGDDPEYVEMQVTVDYANRALSPVRFSRRVPVQVSGVHDLVDTTSQAVRTFVDVRVRSSVNPGDYLVFSWRYESGRQVQPRLDHAGAIWITPAELLTARDQLLVKQFDLPLRSLHEGTIFWSLSGQICRERINDSGSFRPDVPALHLTCQSDGSVTVRESPRRDDSDIED